MSTQRLWRMPAARFAAMILLVAVPALAQHAPPVEREELIFRVQDDREQLTMTVRTSRILELEEKIPRAQVNDPEILDMKALSDKQIQIHAKKNGVTKVNLWDDKGKVYTIEVAVFGDAKELAMMLKNLFPQSSIRVIPTATSVILTGYIDRAEWVPRIERIAEDYFPQVINHMTVGGTQQVLLHVKLMEISRSRLRELGFDFANISGDDFAISSITGLITGATSTAVSTTGNETFAFGIVEPSNQFFGVLSALAQKDVAKILAEPTLVTVSGRPAYFQVGGEIPVLIPQSLGTVSVDFRKFGTQVDFVPIVLGNGNVRLEVRPRVSELDETIGVTLAGSTIPGFRTREVDTGVELQVGQTLCLAGLIQQKERTNKRGFPVLGDLPYVGAAFLRMRSETEEVELLIMVRPELAAALDCDEVPPCGPGQFTRTPTDCELYLKGYMEVPVDCPGGADGCSRCYEGAPGPEMAPPPGAVVAPTGVDPSASRQMPRPPRLAQQAAPPSRPNVTSKTRPVAVRKAVPGGATPHPYNRSEAHERQTGRSSKSTSKMPDLIGPTGYDVLN